METKKIKGEVQAIRKDNRAVEIENAWFNVFSSKTLENIHKADLVEIEYSENTKNGKTFKNLKSIKLQEPKWAEEINSNYGDSQTDLVKQFDEVIDKPKAIPCIDLDSTTKNMIMIVSKDLYLNDKQTKMTLNDWVTAVRELRLKL